MKRLTAEYNFKGRGRATWEWIFSRGEKERKAEPRKQREEQRENRREKEPSPNRSTDRLMHATCKWAKGVRISEKEGGGGRKSWAPLPACWPFSFILRVGAGCHCPLNPCNAYRRNISISAHGKIVHAILSRTFSFFQISK